MWSVIHNEGQCVSIYIPVLGVENIHTFNKIAFQQDACRPLVDSIPACTAQKEGRGCLPGGGLPGGGLPYPPVDRIIGGSKGAPGTRGSPGIQILSCSCSFWQKNLKNNNNFVSWRTTPGENPGSATENDRQV